MDFLFSFPFFFSFFILGEINIGDLLAAPASQNHIFVLNKAQTKAVGASVSHLYNTVANDAKDGKNGGVNEGIGDQLLAFVFRQSHDQDFPAGPEATPSAGDLALCRERNIEIPAVDALTWPVVDRLVARFDVLIALLAMRATRSIVLEELHQGHYNAPVGAAVEEPATKTARKTIKSVKMCPSAGSECNARLLGAKKNNHCGCSSLFETVMAPLLVLSADERHAVLGALADLLRMKHGDAVLPVAFFEGIFWGDGGDLGEHVAEATILDVLVRKARAQMDAKRILQGVKAYRDRGEGNAEESHSQSSQSPSGSGGSFVSSSLRSSPSESMVRNRAKSVTMPGESFFSLERTDSRADWLRKDFFLWPLATFYSDQAADMGPCDACCAFLCCVPSCAVTTGGCLAGRLANCLATTAYWSCAWPVMHVGRCFGLRSLAAVSVHTGKAAVQDLRRLQRRLANLSLEKQQAKLVHRRGEIADKLVQRLRTALELEEGRMSSGGGGSKSTFVSVKHVNDDLHAWMTQQQQKY